MISIRSSISEIERSEEIRLLALDCYLSAIKNASAYVIEFDDKVTRTHREHMTTLARELEGVCVKTCRTAAPPCAL